MKQEKTPDPLLQKGIEKLLKKGVSEGVFPCAAAGIASGLGKERKEIIGFYGNAAVYPEKRKLKKSNFFDLASLTKPLATTLATLCLIKEKKISLDEEISSLLEKEIKGKKRKIRLRDLLNHSSGLPAHREYCKKVRNVKKSEIPDSIENHILQEPLEYVPGTASVYSDLGFILLGRIIERKTGSFLADYIEKRVLNPFNLQKKIFYNPLGDNKKTLIKEEFVATEKCPWRKKILCGEVHDDNCYLMGGVAGHSGIFGNIGGVIKYAGIILDIWKGEAKHPHIRKEDLVYFLARQEQIPESNWALGFDTPTAKDSSSGSYLSKKSVGHLGFTGTSFWIDPEKDIVIVLLSNRVHPSRENIKIKHFRPYFHDRIVEKLIP